MAGSDTALIGVDSWDVAEVFERAPWPVAMCDSSLVVRRANAEWEALVGRVGPDHHLRDVLFADARDELGEAIANWVPSKPSTAIVVRMATGWPARLHLGRHGEDRILAWIVPAFEDARLLEDLRSQAERFEALCANAPVGILFAESGMRVDYVNERSAQVFGAENPDELWGFGWLKAIQNEEDLEAATAAIDRAASGTTVGPIGLRVVQPDGTQRLIDVRFAPIGSIDGGFVATVEDVTEARQLSSRLESQANQDALTGLPNRRAMVAAIDSMIEQGAGSTAALVFVDLDNFKDVNDSLGHDAGDELLTQVAGRMLDCLRDCDMVARFGGDEFVILLPLSAVTVGDVAARVVSSIAAPFMLGERETNVTASAGIVLVGDSSDAEELLRHADIAMYQAKRAGKNRATPFNPAQRVEDERRLALTTALRRTLATGGSDLHVRYQPICDAEGHTVALEALIRWNDPEFGVISPSEFVPLAETAGLADSLGAFARDEAFHDLANWLSQGWDGYMSINLSAREFANPDLVASLIDDLDRYGLPPQTVVVELTETMLMGDVEEASRVLTAIADEGMRVAIDDFGTGYSSLAYLKRFPVSIVKVDRAFVAGIDTVEEDRAICETVVALAQALEMTVVAEGVETVEQRDVLCAIGVPLMQGWLYSRALPRDAVEGRLGLAGV